MPMAQLSIQNPTLHPLHGDRWTFVWFPDGIEGNFNSHVLRSDIVMAYAPGAEFEGTIAGCCDSWISTIDVGELAHACESLAQRDFGGLIQGHAAIPLDPDLRARLHAFSREISSVTGATPGVLRDARVQEAVRAKLTDLIAHAVHSVSLKRDGRPVKAVPYTAIVRQVEEFVRSGFDHPIQVSDLCSLTGVNERTLERSFQRIVGTTPQAYLKAFRLNRVRAELERPTAGITTVASAAVRWGFLHFGRFAAEYRQFFGEFPSTTLSHGLRA